MHENGVVAVFLQVLAKGIEVVFGVGRPHEVVFHHGRNAGQNGRQYLKVSAAVRHAVERKALAEQRVEERRDGETPVAAVETDHFLPDIFQDDDDKIVGNAVDAQRVVFDKTVGCQVFMDGGEVAVEISCFFFQSGFVGRDEAKRRVEQDGRVLRVGVVHGGLNCDGVRLKSATACDDRHCKHDDQTDGLMEVPMGFFFLFGCLKLGIPCYYNDNQYKQNENDKQVPIIE